MKKTPDLLVTAGLASGKRFTVPEGGLRLGRSSANDISIPEEALSRNHCLFERAGENALRVIDLGSSNGTYVNGESIGSEAVLLAAGDVVEVGDSRLEVVGEVPRAATSATVAQEPAAGEPPAPPAVDLGLGATNKTVAEEGAAASAPRRRRQAANLLWLAAVTAVAGSAWLLLAPTGDQSARVAPMADASRKPLPQLRSLFYEKVEADATRIFRYQMTVEGNRLQVRSDDVPGVDRHVEKGGTLAPEALARLVEIVSSREFEALDATYSGMSAVSENALHLSRVRVVTGDRAKSVVVENAVEPEAFRDVREALEAFSRNELGIWAIQYSKEKLIELSAQAERSGDAKWEEREVEYGNLSACIRAYREAIVNLETVNPKPEGYAALKDKLRRAETALDEKFRDQSFAAEKAVSLADWNAARRELRTLCDLVPDRADSRHAAANAKLLDVENRLKKEGGRK